MRREVAGPEHTGDHALCVTVCNVEVDLQGTDVIDVECRSTLCRVEVDWQDRASQSRFFDQTASTEPFKTSGSARIYKDEYGEVVGGVIYLAKKGESIPK